MNKKKIVGLIGYPLSHSFSRKYFTEKFRKEEIKDFEYQNFEIDNINKINNIIESNPDLIGLNVTIPYKEAVIPHLDNLSEQARRIGAVNTILIDRYDSETKLSGHNTDCIGFSQTLDQISGFTPSGALVLGSGGASKAVIYELEERGIPFLQVSRTEGANKISYQELSSEIMNTHTLIVNTTPLGMYPNTDQKPNIPYNELSSDHCLIDLIYNPLQTLFLQLGKNTGARTMNGLPMLISQAEASWELWDR